MAAIAAAARECHLPFGHPAVADASVLGVPDGYYGEVVGAAIRPAGDRDASGLDTDELAAELADYCRARLAAEKVPARWLVTGSFPMTPSGKIRKDELRAQLGAASPSAATPSPATPSATTPSPTSPGATS